MKEEEKYSHIHAAISFTELVRSTLGPRGMNKMIVGKNGIILTNDGATIVNELKGGNPILDLFKNLAKSQELEVGDGTTTSIILAGQMLQNAIHLINKGIHPTIIIQGYHLANNESMNFLSKNCEKGGKEQIIRTAFGSKLGRVLIDHLTKILMEVKDFHNLRQYKMDNSNPYESEIFKGYVFPGFTINERMKDYVKGRIAVLDFPTNLELDKFNTTTAKDLKEVQQSATDFKKDIVKKLVENGVKCVFYTDTNVEIESYITDAGITGIVLTEREHLDWICKASGARASTNLETIDKDHIGEGEVRYVKQKVGNRGHIFVSGDLQTLILKGPTKQILDEMDRAVNDVVSLMKYCDNSVVVGAGAVEIELSRHLNKFAKQIGGKEQLAIEKFAESIEAIPSILAENCGLDSVQILTNLKSMHEKGLKTMGVDAIQGISDAKERGIIEPVKLKMFSISSANDVTTSILKLDQILAGEENEDKE